MQKKKQLSYGVLVALLLLIVVVWWQRVAIYDWSRLQGYAVPADVAALADKTTMNAKTRRIFYVNRPAIENKSQFNVDCAESEQTIVLGCYISGRGIFLYKVDDPRLNGVLEVTAAHEVLHAAYQRLSSTERGKVDQMTAAAYAKVTDQRIRKTVDAYREKDPSVVPNELHSILGTEVRNLPADLESYFSKYFTNRGTIVGYSEKYQQEFSNRQNQIDTYDGQLKNLKQQIDGIQQSLDSQEQILRAQKAEMDNLYASGRYQEFNAQVSSYNTKVRQYNSLVSSDQTLIDRYNELVASRNAIALEESQLVKAIDSRPTTVKTE